MLPQHLAACAFILVAPLLAQEMLSNESVLKLVRAGMSEEVITSMIASKPGKYAVSTDDMIGLKQAGVSDKILAAMVNRPSVSPLSLTGGIPGKPLELHDGTSVRLRLTRNLTSAEANTGDTIDFEVLEDVKVEDVTVIARGAKANGTITDAEHKRRMARGGKLNVTIDFVRMVNDDKVALRGVRENKGGGHSGAMTGGIVATSLVLWPAAPFFLFMHGREAVMPKGTEIIAYSDGEIKLDRSKFTPK